MQLSASPTLGRAVGHCAHCAGQVQAEPSLAFYQAAAAFFAVLLLTGVVGEIREIRAREAGQRGPRSRHMATYLSALVLAMVLSILGELIALAVLLTGSPGTFEQIAVAVCLVVAVLLIPLVVLLSLSEDRLREMVIVVRVALAVVLGLAIGAAVYFSVKAITTQPVHTYHVFGTCVGGACGLNERRRPSLDSPKVGQLQDGDLVEIVCQVEEGSVKTREGVSSRTWDKLVNGHYVSDVGVDTPRIGSEIPAC